VLRNIPFTNGDVIIYFDTIYGACEKTVTYITELTPAESRKIDYIYPVSDAWLLQSFRVTIAAIRQEGKTPRLAIFDTIVSMPGVRMPFEELTKICHEEEILSFVDGAHGVGMLPPSELNLSKLKPDFFVSNLHKYDKLHLSLFCLFLTFHRWLLVPRGCAIFYCALKHQPLMRSTIPTSHGFAPLPAEGKLAPTSPLPPSDKPAFVVNFEFVGTIDNSPYLCVPAALSYRLKNLGGEDAITSHLLGQAREAGQIVSKALGTKVLENEEQTLGNCAFSNVLLPLDVGALSALQGEGAQHIEVGFAVRNWLSATVFKEYGTFLAFMWYGGQWWVRLSAMVYLQKSDFEKAATILIALCDRVKKGEFMLKL
jgi:selenocysteine lyase/cysteine desulfurase